MADRPIVFLGPSLAVDAARTILDADYRRPVRRGDLDDLPPGSLVGLIDGVFEQELAISLREVQTAVDRGVVVFGGASMGALRAAEVPSVIGVGTVFEWYAAGRITRDDEVALLFDEDSGRALTTPTVNVRFAVERLCRTGTIAAETRDAILEATIALPYKQRTYRRILERAGLGDRDDAADLAAMLDAHDVKALDAHAVLEALDGATANGRRASHEGDGTRASMAPPPPVPRGHRPDDAVLIWESGDQVRFGDVVELLAYTGELAAHLRRDAAEAPRREASPAASDPIPGEPQATFVEAVRRWGWMSPEEAEVTLADLGLGLEAIDATIASILAERDATARRAQVELAQPSGALRAELFLDEMALKRAVLRLGALQFFALRPGDAVGDDERRAAREALCRANGVIDLASLRRRWAELGLDERASQDAFIETLATARQRAGVVVDRMRGATPVLRGPDEDRGSSAVFPIPSAPKPDGEARFCRSEADAHEEALRLRDVIGVSRIGMIGELADLGGVQIAQVARPGGAWSSSYGSGKARTEAGAIVGGMMEELEKWSQEQFVPDESRCRRAPYAAMAQDEAFVDPATLDLPYDSSYRPDLPLDWYECADLIAGSSVWLPLDVLTLARRPHDICFSARGSRKHLATNGLGSGFSRAEAVLHAVCEYVERHALRLAELFLANPGGLGPHPYRFVDLDTLSASLRDLTARLAHGGATLRVLDITSDVVLPTFQTVIVRDGQRAEGYACHPHAETAIEMATLEAAQTVSSAVAGAREDLSIKARSLGRHERPRPVSVADAWFWRDRDVVTVPASELLSFSSDDVLRDVSWVLGRVARAGLPHCAVLDLSRSATAPAHVVRTIIPGLETNNPFFTGERARAVLLRDLVPRWR